MAKYGSYDQRQSGIDLTDLVLSDTHITALNLLVLRTLHVLLQQLVRRKLANGARHVDRLCSWDMTVV